MFYHSSRREKRSKRRTDTSGTTAQENVEMPEYVTVSINEEFVASEDKEFTVLKEGDNVISAFHGGGC